MPPPLPKIGEVYLTVKSDGTSGDQPGLPPVGGVYNDPQSADTSAPAESGGVGRFISTAWEEGPVTGLVNIVKAARDPMKALQAAKDNQVALFGKAKTEYDKGNYEDAAVHAFNGLIPLLGPKIDELAERGAKGDWSGLLGGATGVGLSIATPELIAKAPAAVKVAPGVGAGTAAERAAVQFAESRGIPVDAATVTGNQFVKGAQYLADRTAGGSVIAQRAAKAKDAGLTATFGEIADTAHPSPVSPEQAGQAIRDQLTGGIVKANRTADTAYDSLRAIEAKRPILVDYGDLKRVLQPIRDRMYRQLPVTVRQNSPGFQALEQVLAGPDKVPLSTADADLSTIKSMTREAEPYLRSSGQGIAAKTSGMMDRAVLNAAAKAGPDAFQALQDGRAATRLKYDTADLLGQFSEEPVKAFTQATLAKDAGIGRLRALAAKSPDVLPQVGRAYLDDLAAKATADGGFSHVDRLYADWQKLGPETKNLLFSAQTAGDLDKLLLFAKRAAESPNPSGTGHVMSMVGQGGLVLTNPLTGAAVQMTGAAVSKLLRTPAGIRALRDGLTLPLKHPIASRAFKTIAEAQAQTVGHLLAPAMAPATARDQPGMSR